jgi:lysophospholipase L1-like esterase
MPIAWIYMLLVHLALALFIYKSGVLHRLASLVTDNPSENTALYDVLVPYHERMDGSVPNGAIVFLGDSLVHTLVTSAVADRTVNYGIGADTVAGLRARLPVYESLREARAIVLSIGVNDLWYREPQEIIPRYDALLSELPSHVPVVANAVFPVMEGFGVAAGTNAKVLQLNKAFAELVNTYPNIHFVDNHARFTNESGELRAEYHIGDGLHLSSEGYAVWIDVLQQSLSALTNLRVSE